MPYNPDTEDIWKYYKVIKITPIVIDKLLVILLTIPIIDSTLELNIYRVHNLPAIPPGYKIATTYLLEGDYFAIGKHGVYTALPNERSIQVCLESDLAICMLGQALYPTMHITWCIYTLFVEDVARVGTEPTSQDSPDDVGTKTPQREELNLHPIRMRDILQTVLQDERTGIKYRKYLDWQARRQGPGEHSCPPSQIPELEAPGATH